MMESSGWNTPPAASGGASLIEVLAALAVLSFGLVGLAATQYRTLAYLNAVSSESRAAMFAADMTEQLHGRGGGIPGASELGQWQAEIASALPAGGGTVCRDSTPFDGAAGAPDCDGAGNFLAIKLWWDEDEDGNAERLQVAVQRF